MPSAVLVVGIVVALALLFGLVYTLFSKVSGWFTSLFIMIAMVLAFVLVCRNFLFEIYIIPTGSMEPTIAIDEQVIGDRVSLRLSDPAQGDIVTFADPDGSGVTLVKRVIATGGQTVDIVDGNVTVDGVVVLKHASGDTEPMDSDVTYPFVVPDGHVWVMGDNRENSSDSRVFGSVPLDAVESRVFWRLHPFTRFGPLD